MTIEELEAELATRKGFAARVQPPALLWNVGAVVAIVGFFLVTGAVMQGAATLALNVLAVSSVVTLLLFGLGLVEERRKLRPLHEEYLARGWLSTQVPSGLVVDNSGDGGSESVLYSGRRDRTQTRIVLVGGPGQPAEVIEAAAAATRDELSRMPWRERFEFGERVREEGYRRGGDASRVYPVPPGTLLAVETGRSPFVVVIPASNRSRRGRPRFYAVKTPRPPRRPRTTRGDRGRSAQPA